MLRARSRFIVSMFCVVMVLLTFAVSSVFAGLLDKLKSGGSGGGSNISRSDIDGLYKIVAEAEALLQKSVDAAAKMLLKKEDIDKWELRLKEIEKTQDPKEKEAEMRKVNEEKLAATKTAAEREETAKSVASLSADQKTLLANSVYNVILAGLKDKKAVETSKKIADGLKANQTAASGFAADVPKVSKIASTMPSQTKNTVDLGSALLKMTGCQGPRYIPTPGAAANPHFSRSEVVRYCRVFGLSFFL
jgi:uncharacterized protein YdaU (DUF1376 family)